MAGLYSRPTAATAGGAEGTVETEQIDKRVSWLDEQRRKDSEHIAQIHERLDELEGSLRKQDSQLEGLATELARLSALAARVHQFDESLSKHREEVNRQLQTVEERRMSRENQLDSIRKVEQKQMSESLDEMRNKLRGLEEIQQSLEVRRQEEHRLNRSLDELEHQVRLLKTGVEERGRDVAALRENRKQDAKHLGEVDSRHDELSKRLEAVRGSLEAVEDQVGKLKAKLSDLERGESELRHAQTVWSEQQSVRLAEFERRWKAWEKKFEEIVQLAQSMDKRLEGYQETYRELVRLRDQLKGVTEALERRITEVGEIQRLNAERFKEEWAGFLADEQKRWTGFKLNADELWSDHRRTHGKLDAELATMQSDLEDAMGGLAQLSRSSRERLREMLALMQDWGAEIENEGERHD